MLKRFIKYYKPHKFMFTLDMLASLLISIIGLAYPILTRVILNDFIPNSKIDLIIYFGIGLLCLYFIRMLLRYFVQYYGHVIGIKMQAQMRKDMFVNLQKLPYSYYDNEETGKIMSRMTNDLVEVSELAHHGPENLLICGVMIIGSFIYLLSIEVVLTLIIFSAVPFLVVTSLVLRKRMNDAFTESRKDQAVINASLESSITGIRVTKAFTNQNKELEKFEKGNNSYVNSRRKAYKAMGQFFSSTSFITDVFNVIVIVVGGIFIYHDRIDLVDFSAFIISVNLFISPVNTLINFVEQYQNGVTGFKRFLEIIDEEPEKDEVDAIKVDSVLGDITFDKVSFTYTGITDVLDNISLNIKKGTKVALVGPSGGGKTTICHLLPRFYDICEGAIYIDDINIKNMTLDSLRKLIGIVQQDVFLFSGSIMENVLYGKLDASYQEVVEACKKANIHDYILSLENGYDTQIGERGVKLSGGQKQRLSIARVFLKNPPILILDEATSALDNTTEILIQQALDELCLGRTTIVVAHRLSTIKNADEIVVISGGKILEQGSHKELINKDSLYNRLYRLQFREEDLAFLNEKLVLG